MLSVSIHFGYICVLLIKNIKAMSKRKLSKQQQTRILSQQENISSDHQMGQVVAHFGRQVEIMTANYKQVDCVLKPNLPPIVVGDWVTWAEQTNSELGLVLALKERDSIIGRQNKQGQIKPIAANISQILIVTAVVPTLQFELLDKYLINANYFGIEPVIIFNKIDLIKPSELKDIKKQFVPYENIGYKILFTSQTDASCIKSLLNQLANKTSVFIGQSGVGKSSLLNAILPTANAKTKAISDKNIKGRHTTTTARLYHLDNETGSIVDSPGIRDLMLSHLTEFDIASGFIEFRPYLGTCYYSDCKHIKEPSCAIKQAIEQGKIDFSRYQHYKTIINNK